MANRVDIDNEMSSTAQIELHGTHEFKVDAKGRLTLPSKFRKVLPSDLVITLDPSNQYLMAFPPAEFSKWAKQFVEDATGEFKTNNTKQINLRRRIMARANDVDVDNAGRITLKENLRNKVGIDRQVVVVGNDTYFEIWAAEKFDSCDDLLIGDDEFGTLEDFMN